MGDADTSLPRDDLVFDDLRQIIEEVAQEWRGSHRLVETIKWGQPSFALSPKHGTAVRMGRTKDGSAALFVHCATSVVEEWREACALAGIPVKTEGTRALIVDPDRVSEVRGFIHSALSYRRG